MKHDLDGLASLLDFIKEVESLCNVKEHNIITISITRLKSLI